MQKSDTVTFSYNSLSAVSHKILIYKKADIYDIIRYLKLRKGDMMKIILSILLSAFFLFSIPIYAEEPTQESTAELYIAFFDRASDAKGLDYWLKSGLSLEQISENFFYQEETQKKYPNSLTNEEFITTVYKNLFEHEPDEDGLEYWVRELDSGTITRSSAILDIIRGALGDDKIIVQNKTEVGLYFAESGLNDSDQARAVMEGVTVDTQSVEDAKAMIDEFANQPITPESLVWTQQYGTVSYDYGKAVTTDNDGYIYIVGATGGNLDDNTRYGGWDIFLTKFSKLGTRIWTKQYGAEKNDIGYGITVDNKGDIYITGERGGDVFVSKIDSDGQRIWNKVFGSINSSDIGHSIAIDSAGYIYITGVTYGNMKNIQNLGGGDIFLAKFTNDGTNLWIKQYGSTEDDIANSVGIDSQDDIFISGSTLGDLDGNTQGGYGDIFLSKFNSEGIRAWTTLFGSYASDVGSSMDIDRADNIYITGGTSGDMIDDEFVSESWNIFLTKLNTEGETDWTRQYGTSELDFACSVTAGENEKVYITGVTSGDLANDNPNGKGDIFLSEFDSSGVRLSTEQYGSKEADIGYSLTTDRDGDIYITGATEGDLDGNSSGDGDIFLSKFE